MTFLNAVLLGGAAAAAIPVLLHLLNRSRFRVVPWGAMHLLRSVLRRRQRRVRLEQFLLLAVRCAIPLGLALCMARPVLTGSSALLGQAKTSTLLLVDDSYSMEAGGVPLIAREAAGQVLEGQAPGSDAAVLTLAGPGAPALSEPTFDTLRLRDGLQKLPSGFGIASIPEGLRKARDTIGRMHHPHREVVLFSDFQRVSWPEEERAARARLAELLRAGPLGTELTLFHAGVEARDNVSVDRLEFRPVLGAGQKFQVRAHLRNHGEAALPDLMVSFRVDGRERSRARLALPPRERGQLLFTHVFDEPGSHWIEVRADADPLQADNVLLAAVTVWDRVPALLVTGDPNPEPLRGETDYLDIALRPYGAARAGLADLIATRTIEARELDARALAEARAVVLANVPQLPPAGLRALEDFVRQGGGLLIFPGNRINSAWYNTALRADGRGLLPLPVASLAGTLREAGTHASVVSQHFDHPALEAFNDPRNGDLSRAEVWLWYKFREEGQATVVARLDSGDPFLVEKRFGEGRVLQCCVPCDAEWSNLPVRPFYVPLMQQLVIYLASSVHPPRNVDVGRPLAAALPPALAGQKAVLTDPGGRRHELPVVARGAQAAVEFRETERPGLYTLAVPGVKPVHFVVNTDRRESDLRRLGEDEIREEARSLGASLVTSWEEYRHLDQARRFGRELWPLLLAAVLALLFLEIVLVRRLGRAERKP